MTPQSYACKCLLASGHQKLDFRGRRQKRFKCLPNNNRVNSTLASGPLGGKRRDLEGADDHRGEHLERQGGADLPPVSGLGEALADEGLRALDERADDPCVFTGGFLEAVAESGEKEGGHALNEGQPAYEEGLQPLQGVLGLWREALKEHALQVGDGGADDLCLVAKVPKDGAVGDAHLAAQLLCGEAMHAAAADDAQRRLGDLLATLLRGLAWGTHGGERSLGLTALFRKACRRR